MLIYYGYCYLNIQQHSSQNLIASLKSQDVKDAFFLRILNKKQKNQKSFPTHLAHGAAVISDSLALSQTPAEAARP